MVITEDEWLSACIGYPVFRIEAPQDKPQFLEAMERHASRQHTAMYYVRITADQIETVRRFSAAGFYVVDVGVTFGLKIHPDGPAGPTRPTLAYEIAEISPEMHEDVLEIAATCFRYSRFHQDPGIPPVTANRIKREWIRSYIEKRRGEALWVASSQGRPIGFLAVLGSYEGGSRIRIIDLIGVSIQAQNRGVGRALVQFFMDRYAPESDYLEVGTQIANIPSLRLYSACGFLPAKSVYVMHRHVRVAGARDR